MRKIIDKLEAHLSQAETTFLGKLKNVLSGAVLYLAWAIFVIYIYEHEIPEFKKIPSFFSLFRIPPSQIYTFITICIFAPFIEEVFYRTPLSIAKEIKIKGAVLYTAMFSSILFGSRHELGNWSVPIQGVAGLLFCYVYIKNGYSFISSLSMHFLINLYYFLS